MLELDVILFVLYICLGKPYTIVSCESEENSPANLPLALALISLHDILLYSGGP